MTKKDKPLQDGYIFCATRLTVNISYYCEFIRTYEYQCSSTISKISYMKIDQAQSGRFYNNAIGVLKLKVLNI